MSVSMRCPSCDTYVNAGDRECWLCHSRLPGPELETVEPSFEAPPAASEPPAAATPPPPAGPASPTAPETKPARDSSMIIKAPRPPAAASAQPATRVLESDTVSRHGLILIISILVVAGVAAVIFAMSMFGSGGGSGPASQAGQNATAAGMVASLDDVPANWSVEVRRASQGPAKQFDLLGQVRHCATPAETKLVSADGDHTSVTYNDETGANSLVSDVTVQADPAHAQAFMRLAGGTCYPAAVGEIVAGPRGEAALAAFPLGAPKLGDEVHAFRVAQNGIAVDDVVIRHGRAVEQLVFRSTGAPISDADRNAIVQKVDQRMAAALRA
jgi:hypothetical protein